MLRLSDKFAMLFFLIACTSCTVNLIQTDTHGFAEDVVDDVSKTDANVDANLSIPIKPL